MSLKSSALTLSLLISCLSLFGNTPPEFDDSKAAPDGPFVFYRGQQIVVKMLLKKDAGLSTRTDVFTNKNQVTLTCQVDATKDRFSFPLKTSFLTEASEYPLPSRMLVLSDIEGNFSGFKTMLQSAGVVDQDLKWTFGDGHLVLPGDFFDRGLNVTECLWLVYKLEQEALQAGGKVHFIIGNHEVLNLVGDTRDVRNKYIENARLIAEPYIRWYDEQSELGRWLRTKNAVVKIGDYVFCHGGISPELVASRLSLSDINRLTRQNLGKTIDKMADCSARTVFDQHTGIFWYRSMAKGEANSDDIDRALNFTGGRHIVVGHTLHPDIAVQYGGRVICVDLHHEENMRQGFMKSLWIERGAPCALDSKGLRRPIRPGAETVPSRPYAKGQ